MSCMYVDGCCNNTIGSCASVVDGRGFDLIGPHLDFLSHFKFLDTFPMKHHRDRIVCEVKFTDVASKQHNGAELIAMCIGLVIGIYYKYEIIFSDSQLMVNSWSLKESTTIKDPYKAKIQRYCIELRKIFERRGGKILKISGDDNPADLGFHKK